ncbi:MAG: cytochrome-c peroxidase [Limisphaerales bacterium]
MRSVFFCVIALAGSLVPAGKALADAEQTLGNLLFTDPNLSLNRNQSCSTCHSLAPATDPVTQLPFGTPGFVDPLNVLNGTPVSAGSTAGDFGSLNAPSVGYAAFSPDFFWDPVAYVYTGGLFWDGRATNLEAQAAAPLLNPVEMGMPSEWAVVTRLKENTNYVSLFQQIYGLDLGAIPAGDLASATNAPPGAVPAVYAAATQAIAEFERSPVFNRFTSKFDFWLAGLTTLNSNELSGYNLFNGRANCADCHVNYEGVDSFGNPTPPLLTDFSYANVGSPRNWNIPGTPAPDPGLGGRPDIAAAMPDGSQLGLHKTMSLRNIAITPPYGHNGVFSNLQQVVHFYNTRDTLGRLDANTNAGFGITGWPPPEISSNLNVAEIGNLRLSAAEEAQIVAFLETLTDNYPAIGGDPNVPPGTPSPFANPPLPTIPVKLSATGTGSMTLWGRLGKSYQIQFVNSLFAPSLWQPLATVRLGTNGLLVVDTNTVSSVSRFYRAVELP